MALSFCDSTTLSELIDVLLLTFTIGMTLFYFFWRRWSFLFPENVTDSPLLFKKT